MPSFGPQQLWDATLGELQVQVARPTFETFLKGTVALDLSQDQLVIGAANLFTAEYLEQRMATMIRRTVEGLAQRSLTVSFRVAGLGAPASPAPDLSPDADPQPVSAQDHAPPMRDLFPAYTFDAFVVGPSNELAYAAARAVAEAPGQRYNPLFLHSPVGLGKTHLLQAIAHQMRQRGCNALYQTSEQFTNAFVRAIRDRAMPAFRRRYRALDALLIDDIQFIGGKEQTQEGFFHLFNALHQAGKQIVLSADRSPKELPSLGERLSSRFSAGLLADIQPPSAETRLAILQLKTAAMTPAPPAALLEALAQHAWRSVREMEGCLNRLLALADLCGKPLTLDLLRQVLGDLAPAPAAEGLAPQEAMSLVAAHYGLPTASLSGPRRDRQASLARRVSMYLLRDELHQPPAVIARLHGGRHPSAVHQACKQVERQITAGSPLRADVSSLRAQLAAAAPRPL